MEERPFEGRVRNTRFKPGFSPCGALKPSCPYDRCLVYDMGLIIQESKERGIMRIHIALIAAFALTISLTALSHAQTETTLYSFTGASDGYLPFGGLVFDAAGSLYGTNYFGGTINGSCPVGCGTVFQLTQSGGAWTFNTLHSFAGDATDVGHSYAHVTFDPHGNLFGTGGTGGGPADCYSGESCGGVFELSRSNAWKETIIFSFTPNTGLTPYSGLTFEKGSFYGTTWFGPGSKRVVGDGTVYSLSLGKNGLWNQAIVHSFTGGSDGYEPTADLVFDQHGHLYGSTPYGGTDQAGDVFELNRANTGWTLNLIDNANASTLIVDKSGNLYGSSSGGGSSNCQGGCGTVFKLQHTATGWRQTTLYEFTDTTDGFVPGALVFDAEGNLYGTTMLGGTGTCEFFQYPGCGTVFKLAPAKGSWQKTTLYNFIGGTDGEFPNGNALVMDSSGSLYGATLGGATYGSSGYGTIYEIRP